MWPWKRKIKLASGSILFRVPLEDGAVVDWASDLMVLRLTCLDVQSMFLEQDGKLRECPEFYQLLSKRLTTLGCPRSTPTLAGQIWRAVNDQFQKMERDFVKQISR